MGYWEQVIDGGRERENRIDMRPKGWEGGGNDCFGWMDEGIMTDINASARQTD